MKHFEAINPIAEKAAARRAEWEAHRPSFMTRKRFDNIDLILVVVGTASLTIGLVGLVAAIS